MIQIPSACYIFSSTTTIHSLVALFDSFLDSNAYLCELCWSVLARWIESRCMWRFIYSFNVYFVLFFAHLIVGGAEWCSIMRRMVRTLALSSSVCCCCCCFCCCCYCYFQSSVKVFVCTAKAHQNTAQFSLFNIDLCMHIDMLMNWKSTWLNIYAVLWPFAKHLFRATKSFPNFMMNENIHQMLILNEKFKNHTKYAVE